ncbi:hypothetical protein KSF_051600 [Reticulibacter mediterranei]|uniref:Uncharacterized protein n=1 Tax=Reticulibacter mediterranei TaxID=2778369 RepID=A0A8J3IQI3_9CHLR|nr:hypothetical protein [Reticulibacter mediterranei]GHO95112.1 hypothetical protein KSF_051600 [Reticulibacter mediterranei]
MFDTTSSQPLGKTTRFRLLHFFKESFALHPLLTLVGMTNVLVLLAALGGIVVDHRIITGMPAWVKPAKFAISISIYSFTLLWLLSFIKGQKRLVSMVANGTAVFLTVEIVIIVGQVIRGTTSHFNNNTPLDRTLFLIMAVFIALVFVMGIVAAILLLLQRQQDLAFTWTLRLSMFITLVGMAAAFLMTRGPTPQQLEMLRTEGHTSTIGAHSVGVLDGGPGLPFVGWSTEGGDLRIPHFVGLHALQVLPLFWWLFLRRSRLLRDSHRVALVWTVGAGYLGVVGLLVWQALRAQPLIAPDADTLNAFSILISAVVLTVVVIVLHARTNAKIV